LVDPGFMDEREFEPFAGFMRKEGLRLEAIFVTHGHFDHISGVKRCLEAFGAVPVYRWIWCSFPNSFFKRRQYSTTLSTLRSASPPVTPVPRALIILASSMMSCGSKTCLSFAKVRSLSFLS
ncbi:MAG: MBL fold metallo-hydrolase, partial [Methanomicrobium sp.]|nr:MBL fold metallo-hydrolase [Methanomicrobium sp.]